MLTEIDDTVMVTNEKNSVESLYDQFVVVTTDYDAFTRLPVTGLLLVKPRDVVGKYYFIVFDGTNMLCSYAEGLPYRQTNKDSPTISFTDELPESLGTLKQYAQDLRFNSKAGKIVFHASFWATIPIVNLRRLYHLNSDKIGKLSMSLFKHHKGNPAMCRNSDCKTWVVLI